MTDFTTFADFPDLALVLVDIGSKLDAALQTGSAPSNARINVILEFDEVNARVFQRDAARYKAIVRDAIADHLLFRHRHGDTVEIDPFDAGRDAPARYAVKVAVQAASDASDGPRDGSEAASPDSAASGGR